MPRIAYAHPYFHRSVKKLWLKNLTDGRYSLTEKGLMCVEPNDINFHFTAVGVLIDLFIRKKLIDAKWEALSPSDCIRYGDLSLWGLRRETHMIDPYYVPYNIVDQITAYKNPNEYPNQRNVNKIFLNNLSEYEIQKKRSIKRLIKLIDKGLYDTPT